MPEARAPKNNEVSQLIDFLDKHLRPGSNWSIDKEYPLVFDDNNLENIKIIMDKDHAVLAHAATKYLITKSTAGLFKVATIGSVLTAPEHRGQGLSNEVLNSAIQAAERECADFAILWTDLFDHYRKLGFELAGTEWSFVIDNTFSIPTPAGLRILKSNRVDPQAILKVYSQHTCNSIRTSEEIRRYLQIPNANVYTAWAADNRLVAYAIEGKGADLQGYIHEWGGGVNELMSLFSHIRNDLNKPITILVPQTAQNLSHQLQTHATTIHQGFLGMIRIVSEDLFFLKVHRHARRMGVKNFVLEKKSDKYLVGTTTDTVILNSCNELVRLIFGPLNQDDLTPEFQKLFPIPLWIWGWDSI
jgi:GNAT superfamily N-acetyltransferase